MFNIVSPMSLFKIALDAGKVLQEHSCLRPPYCGQSNNNT